MKKLILSVLATFLSITIPVQANFGYTCDLFENIKEASAQYGKRGRALNAIILNALSTKNNVWVRKKYSYEGEQETWARYTPENANNKHPERSFIFSELDLSARYKNHNVLNVSADIKVGLKDFDSWSHISTNKNGDLIKHTFEYKINTLFENENNICLETSVYGVSQKCLETKPTLDLLGNVKKGELILQGEPKIDETPDYYQIYWVENLGNGKFRQYSYKMIEKIATEEEKTFLLGLFKKMEEQIKKIPS